MKIRVIACCKNEEAMLPFFLQYYSTIADEIIIFDGGSTDSSLDLISLYPKARVIVEQHDKLDERQLMQIRNQAYKEGRENWDWQIVVDIDEFLYHPSGILGELEKFKQDDVTLPTIFGYDMYSLNCPIYSEDNSIVDQIKTGKGNHAFQSKSVVFNPKHIDINYDWGCHACSPTGDIRRSPTALMLLHYNYICYDYFIKRRRYSAERISNFNKEHNFSCHYAAQMNMTEEEFNTIVSAASQLYL